MKKRIFGWIGMVLCLLLFVGATASAGTSQKAVNKVTLKAKNVELTYNGTKQTESGYSVWCDGKELTGVTFENVSAKGSGTVAGDYDILFTGVIEGTTLSKDGKYVVEKVVSGTLTIKPAPLTITAGSASTWYSGSPLTCDEFKCKGLIGKDYVKSVQINGSQVLVGATANVPSNAKILNDKDDDVTKCYDISYVNGQLVIYDSWSDDDTPEGLITEGDYELTVIDMEAKTAEISKYKGTGSGAFTIPEQIGDYKIIAIGYKAFENTQFSSVTINNNITSIGDYAFNGCAGLTSITIPDSVTSIGSRTFLECVNLANAFIPIGLYFSQSGIRDEASIWQYEALKNQEDAPEGKTLVKVTDISGNTSVTSLRYDAMGNEYIIDEIDESIGVSLVPGLYRLYSVEDLKSFANIVNNGETKVYAALKEDITFSASDGNWTPIGNGSNWYVGSFDGQEHKIKGLTVDNSFEDDAGLFGCVGPGGVVQNISLLGGSITGNSRVGGVVGRNSGTVSNCYNTNTITGALSDVGGIVGENFHYGIVLNCHNTGTVTGNFTVGGVAGYNTGIVSNSYNIAAVSGDNRIGGVVAMNEGIVSNCYNTGNVKGSRTIVGGVVGWNTKDSSAIGTVKNCYNTGTVTGDDFVGGVVGENNYSNTVVNCYNTGAVNCPFTAGGVAGRNNGTVENCFYDTCTCQTAKPIGFVVTGTYNVIGLTSAQLTGENALNNMGVSDSAWLSKSDGASDEGQYYLYYPHLKGFNYKEDGTPETDSTNISADNWPSKVEVKVMWEEPESYTYNGSEIKPTVIKVTVGDDNYPEGATDVKYSVYNSTEWVEVAGVPTVSGQYKLEYNTGEKSITKYFTILSPGGDYAVSYFKSGVANSGSPIECINVGDYSVRIDYYDTGYMKGHPSLEKDYSISKKNITITTQSKEFTYTGEAQSWNGYDVEGLVGDDEITAVVTGSITYPSENPVANEVDSYEFTTGKAGNYNVITKSGTLTIKTATIPITITSASQEWIYDGQAHENTEVTITSGSLVNGDRLVASASGSITAVSENKEGNNPVLAGYKIMHGDEDVTASYVITIVSGTLKISKKELTITADSDTKVYDKTALTKDSYTVSGLADGDSIKSVTISGSQIMKGSSENVPSKAVIVNAKGEDVTSSYDITYKNGTLTVTAPDAPALDDDQKPAPKNDLKEDGKDQILVLDPANLPEGYTIEYSTDGGKTWTPVPTGKESGEYTIEVFYKADENHTDFFGDPLNVIIQGVYNQTESDGDWTKGSGKTYTFRIKKAFNDEATYDNLTGVFVDGKKAEPGKDYTPAKGSAIITFAADYLETLSVGEHKIRVTFKDGETSVVLKILAAIATPTPTPAVDATPVTGDTANPFLWTALILLSMAGVAVMIERKRKQA